MSDELYIKKLEDENARLYMERRGFLNLIKTLSENNNLSVKFDSVVNILSTEKVVNYALKNYPIVSKSKSAFETQTVLQIGNKEHAIRSGQTSEDFNLKTTFELFKVIWDDYIAKNGNNKGILLVLEIIGNDW